MKNKRKKQHRLIFPILFLLLFMMGLTAVYAKDTTSTSKVVRLGYVNSPGYEEGKDNEYKTGLGYEYFQNIAYLKNWEYEYVYGSFSELLTMLEKGEIDVFGNVFAHVKHADLFFTFKDGGQFGIRVDHAFVFGILQAVFLNVIPHFFDDFGAGQGSSAYHSSEFSTGG